MKLGEPCRVHGGCASLSDTAHTLESRGSLAWTSLAGESSSSRLGDHSYVIADPASGRAFQLLRQLATSDLSVLIVGETGAGKDGAAHAVHRWSPRASSPFVIVNCAALQDTLVESELFGHRQGAFTGAVSDKKGLLEAADGGTIFLDEVSELSASAQAKLLRVTETRSFTRVGEVRERTVDVRIVAATNCSLETQVRRGLFRQDLFFRLSSATVVLPPLRERPRDVVVLARHFLAEACRKLGRAPVEIPARTENVLVEFPWPGNVRELKSVMQYVGATLEGSVLTANRLRSYLEQRQLEPSDRPEPSPTSGFRPLSAEIEALERKRIREALEVTGGVQTAAARLLEVPLRTFLNKLNKYGLARSRRRQGTTDPSSTGPTSDGTGSDSADG